MLSSGAGADNLIRREENPALELLHCGEHCTSPWNHYKKMAFRNAAQTADAIKYTGVVGATFTTQMSAATAHSSHSCCTRSARLPSAHAGASGHVESRLL